MILKTVSIFPGLILLLAACAAQPPISPVPHPTPTVTFVALPTVTSSPEPVSTATKVADNELFSKVSHSTDILHSRCDPLEIIFDVTIKDPRIKAVMFFFRMKDKATGMVNGWSNGETMRSVGNNIFEFNFRATAIPGNARYNDAWLQYQFVGVDQNQQSLGRSQIFEKEVTFTPKCP